MPTKSKQKRCRKNPVAKHAKEFKVAVFEDRKKGKRSEKSEAIMFRIFFVDREKNLG